MKTQIRSKRKSTGALYHKMRKKKKRDIGRDFIPLKIGKERKKILRTLGGNRKIILLETKKINVVDPASKKHQVTTMISVKENAANPNFVRMNVVTKGAVVETELGLAKVVSRPGQHGVLNGILLKK